MLKQSTLSRAHVGGRRVADSIHLLVRNESLHLPVDDVPHDRLECQIREQQTKRCIDGVGSVSMANATEGSSWPPQLPAEPPPCNRRTEPIIRRALQQASLARHFRADQAATRDTAIRFKTHSGPGGSVQ